MKFEDEIKEIRTMLNEAKKSEKQKSIKVTDYFDVDKLTKTDIDDIDVNYAVLVRVNGFGNKLFIGEDGDIIFEEPGVSMSVEDVRRELYKNLQIQPWQVKEKTSGNGVQLIMMLVDNNNNIDVITKEMQACGWSKSCESPVMLVYGRECKIVSFDPMFQNTDNELSRNSKLLFHWTPTSNMPSIEREGLVPKSQNAHFSYSPRVHFIGGNVTMDDLLILGEQLSNVNKSPSNDGDYTLLSVSTNDIPDDIDFYKDPRYEYGFYTKQTIPPSALNVFLRRKF